MILFHIYNYYFLLDFIRINFILSYLMWSMTTDSAPLTGTTRGGVRLEL